MDNDMNNRHFTVASIPELERSLTSVQRELIDACWERHILDGKPFPRRSLTRIAKKLTDEEIFQGLNGSLLFETSLQGNETGYKLTFHGALLTKHGATLARLLTRLLEIIRHAHEVNPDVEGLSKDDIDRLLHSSNDLPRFSSANFELLYAFFRLDVPWTFPFHLGGVGGDGLSWSIGIKPDVRDLYRADDVATYLDECLDGSYDPDAPVGASERQQYHFGGNRRPGHMTKGKSATVAQSELRTERADSGGASASSNLTTTPTETVATYDLLGREKVTQALRHLLVEREDTEPFAIGLFGHWGSGKSSQVRFLRDEIAKSDEPKVFVAEYNAWKSEKAANVGAMLAQHVVDGLVADKGLFARVWIALQLSALSNTHTKKAMQWRYIRTIVPLACAWPLWLYLGLFFYLVIWKLGEMPSDVLRWGVVGIGGVLVPLIVALRYAKGNLTEWFQDIEAAKKSLSILRLPDYSAHRGLALEVHRTLEDLCSLCLKGKSPKDGSYLLLIVDDLDRCAADGVKEVLDAVRLVANIDRVVTLVAIDERIAFAAVEKHYDKFGHGGRSPELVARDYLAKVLQVSLILPEVGHDGISHYVDNKIFVDLEPRSAQGGGDRSRSPIPESASASGAVIAGKDEASGKFPLIADKAELAEPAREQVSLPEEKDLFKELARKYEFSNPRLLWRLYMAWKLLKWLQFGTQYVFRDVQPLMHMLFWREWLHQQESDRRHIYSKWIAEPRSSEYDQSTMPAAIRDIANENLRQKWRERERLVPVVDCVLLPATVGRTVQPAEATSP